MDGDSLPVSAFKHEPRTDSSSMALLHMRSVVQP